MALTAMASQQLPLSDSALEALRVLEDAGFEAWAVGGCVRDFLMGRSGGDVDICSSALWEEAEQCFFAAGWRVERTGTKHGTITAILNHEAFEITTFRSDGVYTDLRHPNDVHFVKTLEEDLARRDFTINAIAYHPDRGFVDKYGGMEDIENGVIRCIGDPNVRFCEDALRILRGCRFRSQLGFTFDPDTFQAMFVNKCLMVHISAERTQRELDRFLLGDHVKDAIMETVDVLSAILPELISCRGFDQQSQYHIYDVLEHTAHVVGNTPPDLLTRWAALFHDIGKPGAYFTHGDDIGHFWGHARISMLMAQGIMYRLKMPAAFAEKVLLLVKIHDDTIECRPKAVRRVLARMGGDVKLFEALCDLKRADALGKAAFCHVRADEAMALKACMQRVIDEGMAFSLKHLAVNGNDVLAAGIKPGPEIGVALQKALEAVINERVENDHEALLNYIRDLDLSE